MSLTLHTSVNSLFNIFIDTKAPLLICFICVIPYVPRGAPQVLISDEQQAPLLDFLTKDNLDNKKAQNIYTNRVIIYVVLILLASHFVTSQHTGQYWILPCPQFNLVDCDG